MNNIWIIAQTEGGQPVPDQPLNLNGETGNSTVQDGSNGGTEQQNKQQSDGKAPPSLFTWIFPIMMILLVFLMFRAPQKQKQQQRKLETSLEKNDRVMTIGGIIGTIVDIKEDEITLKVDESNNTKIKIRRSAIGRNMSKD